MEAEVVLKALEAVSLAALVAAYVINRVKDMKDINVKTVLDLAISTVEEACAYSEEKNRLKKREAAMQTAKQLKKDAVEISKDPVKAEAFMQAGLKPIREIAHSNAKEYALNAIDAITDVKMRDGVKKILNAANIDKAIQMQIVGPKIGVGDPLKSFLFREM